MSAGRSVMPIWVALGCIDTFVNGHASHYRIERPVVDRLHSLIDMSLRFVSYEGKTQSVLNKCKYSQGRDKIDRTGSCIGRHLKPCCQAIGNEKNRDDSITGTASEAGLITPAQCHMVERSGSRPPTQESMHSFLHTEIETSSSARYLLLEAFGGAYR